MMDRDLLEHFVNDTDLVMVPGRMTYRERDDNTMLVYAKEEGRPYGDARLFVPGDNLVSHARRMAVSQIRPARCRH